MDEKLIEIDEPVTSEQVLSTVYVRSLSEELAQAEKELQQEIEINQNLETELNQIENESLITEPETIELPPQEPELVTSEKQNEDLTPTKDESKLEETSLNLGEENEQVETSVTDSQPFSVSKTNEQGQYCCPEPPTNQGSTIQSSKITSSHTNKKRRVSDTVDAPQNDGTFQNDGVLQDIEVLQNVKPSKDKESIKATILPEVMSTKSVAIQTRFTAESGTNTDDSFQQRLNAINSVQSPPASLSYKRDSSELVSIDISDRNKPEPVIEQPSQGLKVKDEPDLAIATALSVGSILVTGVSTLVKVLRFVISIIPWSTVLNVISGFSTVVTGLETVQTVLKYLRRIPLVGRLFQIRTPTGPVSVEVQTVDPKDLPMNCLHCGRCLKGLDCCPVCTHVTSISQLIVPVVHTSPGPSSPRQRLTSVSLVVESSSNTSHNELRADGIGPNLEISSNATVEDATCIQNSPISSPSVDDNIKGEECTKD